MKKILSLALLLCLSLALVSCSALFDFAGTEERDLEAIYDGLFADVRLDAVTEDLDLKQEVDGVKITYRSADPAVVSDDGVVHRAADDKTVDLRVTLSYGGEKFTGTVTLTVLGTDKPDVPTDTVRVTLDYDEALGSISYAPADLDLGALPKGTSVVFTVTPAKGYAFGEATDGKNEYALTGGSFTVTASADMTIRVTFAKEEPIQPIEWVTVSATVADLARTNGWTEQQNYTEAALNGTATVTMSAGNNSGKYYAANSYNGWPDTWRMYATESTVLTVSVADGARLVSVKIDYVVKDNGVLTSANGNTTYASGEAIAASGSEISFTVGSTSGAKGKVFVTGIEVVYQTGEGGENPPVIIDPDDELAGLKAAIEALNQAFEGGNLSLSEVGKVDGEVEYESVYSLDGEILYEQSLFYLEDGTPDVMIVYDVIDADGKETLYYYDNDDETFYKTSDAEAIGDLLVQGYFYFDYYAFALNAEDFVKLSDGVFAAKADKVNEVAKAFLADWDEEENGYVQKEVFDSFTVKVENGKITEVTASSLFTADSESYPYTYTLTFSGWGEQKLELPDAEEAQTWTHIGEIYKAEKGAQILSSGVVTGFLDRNVYVADETGTILVYFGNASYLPEGLTVGDGIVFQGTLDIYNGLYEVKVADAESSYIYGDRETVQNPVYSDLSTIGESLASAVIDLDDVRVSSLSLVSGKDTSLTLTDKEGHEIVFYIKKAQADLFAKIFADVGEKDVFTLKNAAVAIYKTQIQIVLTEQTKAENLSGVILSKSAVTLMTGADEGEILSGVTVTYYGEDGAKVLTANDYTLNTTGLDLQTAGEYTVTVSYLDSTASLTVRVLKAAVHENVSYDILEKEASRATDVEEIPGGLKPGLPSTGDVEVLVIPIRFTNSKDYDLSRIETAFNGTSEQTGWYSLSGYYKTASYGALNLHANILDPYDTGVAYNTNGGTSGVDDYKYLRDAVAHYDAAIDYTKYDQNGDGCIDCVYLVYLAPVNYDDGDTLWWAYCWEYFEEDEAETFDGLALDWYMWVSYEFFDETPANGEKIAVNCETIIHETGHALGLDDYYDYGKGNDGPAGGLGGFAMMDYNQGDHDPYSKAILGWTNPTVVFYHDYETTLGSFEKSGDSIFLVKNDNGSYFGEYYVISYYTPTGVNEMEKDADGMVSVAGIVIYHVDSTLKTADVVKAEINSGDVNVVDLTVYNNGSGDHKLIAIHEADGNGSIEAGESISAKDLFAEGAEIFGLTWYDGNDVGCTITIGQFTENGVTVSIDF